MNSRMMLRVRNTMVGVLVLCMHCMVCNAQRYGQDFDDPYGPFQQEPSSWQGTGWALNNGYVVTNYHVVDGARSLQIKCMMGDSIHQYMGEVAVSDEEHDLAIIKIYDETFPGFGRLPYALKTTPSDVGESVFVLGFPMTQILGGEIKLTTGIISSQTGYQDDATSYQLSAPIQPGNSGGPLFDDDGNVIAVVNAKVSSAENVGYAIKGIYVKQLIDQLPSSSSIVPANASLVGKPLPEKVKALRSFIFTIYASTQPAYPSRNRPDYGWSDEEESSRSSGNDADDRSNWDEEDNGDYRNGSRTKPTGSRVIEWPYVENSRVASNLRIKKVTITETSTILEFVYSNRSQSNYYSWINIAPETYIQADGYKYRLKRVDGIEIAPDKTYFQGTIEGKVFKLVFPALPEGTRSFDFIEPGESDWKMYGISTIK